jgi:hypothetical protein
VPDLGRPDTNIRDFSYGLYPFGGRERLMGEITARHDGVKQSVLSARQFQYDCAAEPGE